MFFKNKTISEVFSTLQINKRSRLAILNMTAFIVASSSVKPVRAQTTEVFGSAEDKANELVDFLTGPFAIAVGSIVLIVAMGLYLAGRISLLWGVRVAIAGLVIGGAPSIIEWLIGG